MAVGSIIPLDLGVLGGPGSSSVPAATAPARSAAPDIGQLIIEEGADHIAPLVRSVFQQESSSGRNTATSVDNAHGPMQVIPATFKRFALPGESIDNPEHNMRAGIRYLRFLNAKAGGDPAKVFAGYFSGEGNIGDQLPWKRDAADGNGVRVSQYVAQNMRRLTGQSGTVPAPSGGKIIDAPDDLGINIPVTEQKAGATGVLSAAGRGLAHGMIGLAGDTATAASWLAGAMGAHDFKNLTKMIAEDFDRSAVQFAAPDDLQGNILDDPALLKKGAWWAYHIADAVPSFAASMIPGLGASKMVSVAGQALKLSPGLVAGLATIGGSVAAGAVGGGLEGTQTYRTVLERGGTEEEARAAASMMTLASGTLNAISFGKLTGRGTNALRRFLGGFATEGTTEWAEEPAEGAILSSTSVARPEDNPMSRLRAGINVLPIAGVLGGGGAVVAGGAATPAQRQPGEPRDLMQPPVTESQPVPAGAERTEPTLSAVQRVWEETSNLPPAQRVPAGPVDITRVRAAADAAQAPTLTDAPEYANFRLTPPTGEPGPDVNFKLTAPEMPNLGQGELDLQLPVEGPQRIEGQLHLPVFDTPLQTKIKQGGKPTRSELLQTLNAVADPARPVLTKGGDPKRKWLGAIMTSGDPLSAIRSAYGNGGVPQAELLDKWHRALTNTGIEQYETNGGYEPPKPKPAPAPKKRGRPARPAAPVKETVSQKIQKQVKAAAKQAIPAPVPVEAAPVESTPATTQPAKPKRAVKRVADIKRTTPEEKQKLIEDLETAYMRDEIMQEDFEDHVKAIEDGEAGAMQNARKFLDMALQSKATADLRVKKGAATRLQEQLDKLKTSTKSAGRMRKGKAHEAEEPGYDATGHSISLPRVEHEERGDVTRARVALDEKGVQLAHRGDLSGLLAHISRTSDSRFNRKIARLLIPITRHAELITVNPSHAYVTYVPASIKEDVAHGVTMTHNGTGEAKIFLNVGGKHSGLNEQTVLHEAIHAALIARIDRMGGPAHQMLALHKLYKDYAQQRFGEGATVPSYIGAPYNDPHEFVTYAMTNPEFQEFLREAQIEKTSLWDRFVALVARILGLHGDKSYLEQVLDTGVSLLKEATTVAPDTLPTLTQWQRLPEEGLASLSNFVEHNLIGENLPANTLQTLESAGHAARTKWLGAVTLRQLSDLYKKHLPSLQAYVSGVHRMDATVNRISTAASEVAAKWGGVKDADALSEVMGLATTQRIHPDVEYAKQTWLHEDARNADRYNALREKYRRLSPEAKAIYQEARKMLQDHWTEVRELLKTEIGKTFNDPVEKDAKLAQIEHEFGRVQGPYFPLSRFGKYILTAKIPGKEDSYTVEFFENIFERDATQRDLQRQGYQVKTAIASEFNPATDGVPSAFMKGLYDAVDNMPGLESDAAKDMKDAITQLYWRSLPEVAGAKRFLRRRTIKGWNKDMRRSFANAMFHGAFYRAKLQYAPELRRNLLMMDEEKRALQGETGSRDMADAVTNEIGRRHEQAMRRVDTPFVDFLGRVGYIYFLGLTPSFALVNMMQNPMVAYPMLAARFGWTRAFGQMMKAAKEYAGVRFTADEQGRWTAEIDLNRVTPNKAERAALQEWLDEGLIDLTQAHDLSAMASGTGTVGRKITKIATFLPHHTEVFNRVTAGLAAYRLARQAGQSHEAATQYGKEVIANAHFDYSASNKPYYMSPGFSKGAKLVFMFKQYQQHMIYALARNLHQAIKGESQQDRIVARRTLFGLLTMTSLAAGAMGLPFFGTAMLLAQLVYALSDDDDPRDPETRFRQFLADALGVEAGEVVARGALRRTGLDVSERLGLGDLGFRYTGKDEISKESFNQLIVDLLGPIAAIASNGVQSVQFFERGEFQRGFEQLAPKAVKDVLKADRYATEGLTTTRGVRRMGTKDFDTYDILAQAMGFTPRKVAEHYAAQSAVQGAQDALTHDRDLLISMAALARTHGDSETFNDVMARARQFSAAHPRQAITAESIIRAVQRVKEQEALANNQGVYVKPKDRNLLEYGAFANIGR